MQDRTNTYKIIEIRDVLVSTGVGGEFMQSQYLKEKKHADSCSKPYGRIKDKRVDRITASIADHVKRAKEDHLKALLARKNTDKENSIYITRVTFSEFSFFPKDAPLSLDEYHQLIKNIHAIANELPPNVHLQIATMPVLWSDRTVHNSVLYVQAKNRYAPHPLIHHFSKDKHFRGDFIYKNPNSVTYPYATDATQGEHSPMQIFKEALVMTDDPNQFKTALKIITDEGVAYFHLSEVCLDNPRDRAAKNLLGLLKQLHAYRQSIPMHISHTLTSCTIIPLPDLLFTLLTQADPWNAHVEGSYTEHVETIDHPLFGEKTDIRYYPPQPVSIPYNSKILSLLLKYADYTVDDILHMAIQDLSITLDFHAMERIHALLDMSADFSTLSREEIQTLTQLGFSEDTFLASYVEKEKEPEHNNVMPDLEEDMAPGLEAEETTSTLSAAQHRLFKDMSVKKSWLKRFHEQHTADRHAQVLSRRQN